jgi:hypothetical protein
LNKKPPLYNRVSLEEDLKGINNPKALTERLESLLTKKEKVFIKKELDTANKILAKMKVLKECGWLSTSRRYSKLSERWEDQFENWPNIPNPLIRALLELNSPVWNPNLSVPLMLEVPIELFIQWPTHSSTFFIFWERTIDAFKEPSIRDNVSSSFLKELWSTHTRSGYYLQEYLTHNFIQNSCNSIQEKLEIIFHAKEVVSKSFRAEEFLTEVQGRLKHMEDQILSEVRTSHGLHGIPSSWVLEIFSN